MDHILCMHSWTGGPLGHFHLLALVSGASGIMDVQGICLSSCFSSFESISRGGVAGSSVVLCLALLEPAKFLPTAAEPFVSPPEMSEEAIPDF